MLNLLLSLAGIFALIVIVGRLLHRYFIYIPDRTRVAPEEAGLAGVEEVVFKAADGTKLIAWHLPARGPKPRYRARRSWPARQAALPATFRARVA